MTGILRRSHQAMRPHSRRYMVPVDEHTPLPPHCHIQPIRVAGNNRCHLHQQKRYTYGHSSHHLGHPLPDCRIGRLHPAYDSGTARSLCRLVASTFHGQGAVFHHAVTFFCGWQQSSLYRYWIISSRCWAANTAEAVGGERAAAS